MLIDSGTDGARPNDDLKICASGIDFIKEFETFVPYVYDDKRPPVRGKYRMYQPGDKVIGTLTVLIGHTDSAKHPLKIKDCIGKTFTEDFADEVLAVDLEDCEQAVRRLVNVPLTQGQYNACVSFTFNCGEGNFANIAKRLNRGDYAGARSALDLYTKSGGESMRGLQRRRDGEQALWDSVPVPTIAKADTFHPADVDPPPSSLPGPAAPAKAPEELVQSSRKVALAYAYQRLMTWLGFGTAGVSFADFTDPDGPVHQVVSVVKDNALILVLFGCLLGFGVSKLIQSWSVEDHNAGRYLPSKEA